MKRKLTIFLVAATAFLSAFGGGAAFLATAPHSSELEANAKILQQDPTGQAPIAIAGNSWGGRSSDGSDDDGSDDEDEKKDPPAQTDGNSWGG